MALKAHGCHQAQSAHAPREAITNYARHGVVALFHLAELQQHSFAADV
ncbi:MAG: hypothetical protein JOZ99_02860 [Actinobacteria bacterium]|nr:hypothetical protein [Actinomycetota bacterium]